MVNIVADCWLLLVFDTPVGYANYMPLTISEEKPEISRFLAANPIGVLATVHGDGTPHAATIYFMVDADLNIYFVTKEGTAKAQNILRHPQVAFAVYEAATQKTVQINGTAERIEDVSRFDQVFRHILGASSGTSESPTPPVSKISGGEYVLFCITPKTIRLAEYTKPEHGRFDDLFDIAVIPDKTPLE